MNTGKDNLLPSPLVIQISGIGNVPSFKNSKKIVKMGKRYGLITDPKKRKWMDRATQSIKSQLLAAIQIDAEGISTGRLQHSSIALLMQQMGLDDSWQWMPVIGAQAEFDATNPGATIMITIERK
jgi:hypothetical protein